MTENLFGRTENLFETTFRSYIDAPDAFNMTERPSRNLNTFDVHLLWIRFS